MVIMQTVDIVIMDSESLFTFLAYLLAWLGSTVSLSFFTHSQDLSHRAVSIIMLGDSPHAPPTWMVMQLSPAHILSFCKISSVCNQN